MPPPPNRPARTSGPRSVDRRRRATAARAWPTAGEPWASSSASATGMAAAPSRARACRVRRRASPRSTGTQQHLAGPRRAHRAGRRRRCASPRRGRRLSSCSTIVSPSSSALSSSGVPSTTTRPLSTMASRGQPVGLLQVVGGEQDGQSSSRARRAISCPQLGARLAGRDRWSARRGRTPAGRWMRPSARSSLRCMPPE